MQRLIWLWLLLFVHLLEREVNAEPLMWRYSSGRPTSHLMTAVSGRFYPVGPHVCSNINRPTFCFSHWGLSQYLFAGSLWSVWSTHMESHITLCQTPGLLLQQSKCRHGPQTWDSLVESHAMSSRSYFPDRELEWSQKFSICDGWEWGGVRMESRGRKNEYHLWSWERYTVMGTVVCPTNFPLQSFTQNEYFPLEYWRSCFLNRSEVGLSSTKG